MIIKSKRWCNIVFPVALLCWTCTTDSYDKGDGQYSLMEGEMVVAHTNSDKQVDRFVTDANETITLAKPFSSVWMTTPDSTYRAVFYFSRTSNGVEVNSTSRVAVTVPKHIDDMATDPVGIESVWKSKNGRFLNIGMLLKLGKADDEEALQTLGCHIDTLMVNADSTRTLHLRLYHDQGNVPEYYTQRTFVSIPLEEVPADSVSLSINTYKGLMRKTWSTRKD